MQIHALITDTATLAALCERLAQAPFVAFDTEFMRENTFWPELCLVQVASTEEAAAIDPLAPGLDLKPLLELLVDNEEVLKVVHAGGQDLEIVYNLTGKTPHPLFDTQVAAMALGMGEQAGYQSLVESMLGIRVDKGARFTDWARRPLDKRQLDYAVSDVTHLATFFPRMVERLRKNGRGQWLDDEMERLTDPANYAQAPEEAWRRVKASGRNPEMLGRLRALAAWREHEARGKNLPRGRIVKDETLADMAAHPPKSQDDLARVRGLSPTWKTNDIGARLMGALEAAIPFTPDELPDREGRGRGPGKDGQLIADLLRLLLKIRSRDADVAPKLLARAEELDSLAGGQREGLSMLQGWRFEAFGRDALELVEGRLAFAVKGGKLTLTRPDPVGTEAA